jgi:hypothetical protein
MPAVDGTLIEPQESTLSLRGGNSSTCPEADIVAAAGTVRFGPGSTTRKARSLAIVSRFGAALRQREKYADGDVDERAAVPLC